MVNKKANTDYISVRVRRAHYDQLHARAKKEDRTIRAVLERILSQSLGR